MKGAIAESSLEEVELESGPMFTILDSSRPIMLDNPRRAQISEICTYLLSLVMFVLFASFCAPKDHFVDRSYFYVAWSKHKATVRNYRFQFQKSASSNKAWLSAVTLRSRAPASHKDVLFVGANISYASEDSRNKTSIPPKLHTFQYYARRHHSDLVDLVVLDMQKWTTASVKLSVDYGTEAIDGIGFEWSTDNPWNRDIHYVFYLIFNALLGVFAIVVLLGLRLRLEQAGTLVMIALFLMSSITLTSDAIVFHLVEVIAITFLRAFLFYIVAFIANKHRTFIAHIEFALIAMSCWFGLFSAWYSWKSKMSIVHGHDILMHMVLAAVTGSMIAAMYFFAEVMFSFKLYAILLMLHLGTTLLACDLVKIFPQVEHWIEPKITFYGIHLVILSVLVYCHQGIRVSQTDANHLSDSPSDVFIFE